MIEFDSVSSFSGFAFHFLKRQCDHKLCAASRRILHLNLSFVKEHDFFGNAQAQSEVLFILSGSICPVEALKYRFFFFVGNSGAVV